jgi:nicotinate-nucleotide pyrophosphorylase (carboxylating)
MMFELNRSAILQSIRLWLDEDIGNGDMTSLTTIPAEHHSIAIIHVKESGIIAGLPVAEEVFAMVDAGLAFIAKIKEGSFAEKGTILAEVHGNTRSILLGERLALNLMQRLSGIATKTNQYVMALQGSKVRLVDTRKTTPGHRLLEKYAVRVGGGYNHRFGLFDAVLIKDNHIKGAGGVAVAIEAARKSIPHSMKIEVEVESFVQLEEALSASPDIIMLDNMSPLDMRKAVDIIKNQAPHILVEASGTVTLETIREIAASGVDVISVGRLTYSVQALDISLDLNERKVVQP